MQKQKKRKIFPMPFGKYRWADWLEVAFWIIIGLGLIILPCVVTRKVIAGPFIGGILSTCIGIFLIVNYSIVIKNEKIKKLNKAKQKKSRISQDKLTEIEPDKRIIQEDKTKK